MNAVLLALTLLAATIYGIGSWRVSRRSASGRAIASWRMAAGWAGFGLLGLLQAPPVHELSEQLFTFHMIDHVVLTGLVAPFVVLAEPLPAMLWGLPRTLRHAAGALAVAPVLRQLWKALSAPLSGTALHIVALWAWHVPALFDAALETPWLHLAQHASFLITAIGFWTAALSPRRPALGMTLSFVTLTATGLLGALMVFAQSNWYLPGAAAEWGLTPLEDQQVAGLVMWVPASFIYLAAALLQVARMLADPPLRNARARP